MKQLVELPHLSPGIINEELLRNASPSDWIALGFIETIDDSGMADWSWTNGQYQIGIDWTGVVSLTRLDPIGGDTDSIKVLIESLFDLERLLDWVQP